VADFTIVDTDILIDAGRGVGEAISCLQDIERKSALATSAVTQMELFVGCRNKTELLEVEKFLQRFSDSSVNRADF
jgi:predicted nucleic acid-binding protein